MSEQAGTRSLDDLQIDASNLYREELITDLQVATIRRMVPIKIDGSIDSDRMVIYAGETQVLTQAGMLPVSARIEANTLQEAVDRFPAAIKQALEDLMEQAREMQRREASRIIVPKGPLPPTGGGGGIQLP